VTIQEGVYYKDDHETFVVMSSTAPLGTISSVPSLLAITVYKGNHNKENKLCNALSTDRYITHNHVVLECYTILSLPQGTFKIIYRWCPLPK